MMDKHCEGSTTLIQVAKDRNYSFVSGFHMESP
jgi:hypothetical protein